MGDNRKFIQIFISAIVAILFVQFYLKKRESAMESNFAMVQVLAAARDIPARTEIQPDHLTVKSVPLRYLEPGAIQIKEPGTEYDRVRSKLTIAAVPAGGTIISANLNDPSPDKTGVAPIVPPGKRGYLLRLGNLDVQQLILPRDRIDVLATLNIRSGDRQSRATFTILQNVLVLGVGVDLVRPTITSGGKTQAQQNLVLTLALEPVEAQQLDLARKESDGDISVIVRPLNDPFIRVLPGTEASNLLQRPAPPEHQPRAAPKKGLQP